MHRPRVILSGILLCTLGVSRSAQAQARELLPEQQLQQVLNRLGFGPRPGDVAKVRAMGVDKWIELQLQPSRISDKAADDLVASYPALTAKTTDIVRDFQQVQLARRQAQRADSMDKKDARQSLAQNPQLVAAMQQGQRVVADLQSNKLARAVISERQLNEVMVDFWENHFSVFAGKGQTRLFLVDYDQHVIRPHALGKFRDLLGAVAKSPAMLFYLDNWESAADSTHPTLANAGGRGRLGAFGRRPAARQRFMQQQQQAPQRARRGLNENYARELMELHTLGVDGGYTQQDVINVARALTGWTFVRATGEFVFNPAIHDAGEKNILGHRFAGGHGIEEGEQVLDLVARAPQTARFITTKLARHFVSDDPPATLVDRCSQTFSKTDGDIRETVRCIATSPEFFSRSAYRAKVKTPFELLASALRAVGGQPDLTPRTIQVAARLGQPTFGRQTPDGWPDRGDAWMNTGAILNRINFGLSLAGGQIPTARLTQWPQMDSLRSLPRAQQVDGVIRSILGGEASAETREVLMTGENPMLGKADSVMVDNDPMMPVRGQGGAPKDGKGQPRGRGAQLLGFGAPVNLKGLPQVVGLALGAPEFQRR